MPQKADVLPQYPYAEQQLPNVEPAQVDPPFVEPQLPLSETATLTPVPEHLPKPDWQPVSQWAVVLPQ